MASNKQGYFLLEFICLSALFCLVVSTFSQLLFQQKDSLSQLKQQIFKYWDKPFRSLENGIYPSNHPNITLEIKNNKKIILHYINS